MRTTNATPEEHTDEPTNNQPPDTEYCNQAGQASTAVPTEDIVPT
ncbi:hypothetical protein PNP59_11870 [Halobacterium salinarum]|nr:hypothetical protein [Halobacterium salinarum]MDL0131620.1 hypothetical protein [Halobacterium salinarum]